MGIRNAKVRHIGELIGDMFEDSGLESKNSELDVCDLWRSVVGDMVNARTSVSCSDGVLYVKCSGSVVAKQLSMEREGLLHALNSKVGKLVVRKVVIR